MRQNETNETEGGNTKTPSIERRRWSITVNNYTIEEYETMRQYFEQNKVWVIGKEIGEEGTPHLQCYLEKKTRFSSLQKIGPRWHIEFCKGNKKQNIDYCTKDGDYIGNGIPKNVKQEILEQYKDIIWKPWQQEIIDICESKPDDRTIHWYYERKGNVGKSFLVRYLYNKYDCIIGNGKMADVLNNVNNIVNIECKEFKLLFLDIPRSSLGYINYGVIEKLKDKLVYSGKYEGGTINLIDNIHIICFANEKPNEDMMSIDRWNIKII